jgi:hypothetical protein
MVQDGFLSVELVVVTAAAVVVGVVLSDEPTMIVHGAALAWVTARRQHHYR